MSRKVQNLCRWCIENELTISIEKTNFVSFHAPNKPLVKNIREIETEAMNIKRVDVVTYLGVTIDEKLTWNAHVENVCYSLLKFFGILNQMRHKVTKNTVRQMYHAFVYSKIKYGLEVYGNTSLKIYPRSKLNKMNYWNISCFLISEHGLTFCIHHLISWRWKIYRKIKYWIS